MSHFSHDDCVLLNVFKKLLEKDKSLNAKKLGKENNLKSKVRDVKRAPSLVESRMSMK
jgi:hypothetical protein